LSEEKPSPANTSEDTKQTKKEAAAVIAAQLGETDPNPCQTIERSVRVLGIETALTYLKRSLEIEEQGGIMLPDGSRRRTPGGVYFFLLRKEVEPKQRARIFAGQAQSPPTTAASGASITSQPLIPTKMIWAERGSLLDETLAETGVTRTVKMTLIGRPGKIVERGQCITFTMQQSEKIPALPAGLPLPSAQTVAATRYNVYIALKQWKKVAAAIADPEDVLIVEGFPMLDKERGTIAVFASNVTTKVTQMQRKEAQKPASS
jgi:hypothetical protein